MKSFPCETQLLDWLLVTVVCFSAGGTVLKGRGRHLITCLHQSPSLASSLSIQVLSNPESRELHGYDSVVVLTLLINYRKYEVGEVIMGT